MDRKVLEEEMEGDDGTMTKALVAWKVAGARMAKRKDRVIIIFIALQTQVLLEMSRQRRIERF